MAKYLLRCTKCGREYEDDHFRLKCDGDHGPALLRSVYTDRTLTVKRDMPGMFKYIDFLPVDRSLNVEGAPVTYRSEKLAHRLGLERLFVIFNGYWPERGAFMHTASFKELEAPSVLTRTPATHDGTIVVASAGNTGRAFAHICSQNHESLVLVVPEEGAAEIWSHLPYNDSVKLILAGGDSDYFDAITLAGKIVQMEGYFPEGGAANVARRDGMAVTVLDAAATIGSIPDHYFQAVGSGTGGIAAWESVVRLREDGSYGESRMKLHLAQNHPFTPMTNMWNARRRDMPVLDEKSAKDEIHHIMAKVLSNRKPPWGLAGGVFDTLTESEGAMYAVKNDEVRRAMELFEELERIDIHPAGGVALGALMQAVESGAVGPEEIIALNITGGGEKKVKQDYEVHILKPHAVITDEEIHGDSIMGMLEKKLVALQ
jgi:cysteate synthase